MWNLGPKWVQSFVPQVYSLVVFVHRLAKDKSLDVFETERERDAAVSSGVLFKGILCRRDVQKPIGGK